MGYVEDFGTGIPKLFKYCKEYTGYEPIIEDENTFKFILKHNFYPQKTISDQVTDQVTDQVSDQVSLKQAILEYCTVERSLVEIIQRFGYSSRVHFKNKILNPLIEKGLITPTQPDRPNSPTQKYYTVIKEDNIK